MYLRSMTAADIPHCVSIYQDAFIDAELTEFQAPHRKQFPVSWRERNVRVQRSKLYNPNNWNFVAVADANDEFALEGEILGVARWIRQSSKEDASVTGPWSPRQLSFAESIESWRAWAELKWENTLRNNPAFSFTNMDSFIRAIMTSTDFAPIRTATHWYLDFLAVDPKYHRRGIASLLVKGILDQTRTENEERLKVGKQPVPVTLVGTAPGLRLYRSLGFKVLGWADASFLDVPAEGGSVMVWDPTGFWIKDIDCKEPMKRGVVDAVYATDVSPGETNAAP